MINVYDFAQSQLEGNRKLSFKDMLFVHYKCPAMDHFMTVYTHLNYILYVLSGKKVFHQPGYSYPLTEGTCVFIRKGAFKQEQFFDEDWQVMAFFVPDNYLQGMLAEYRAALPMRSRELHPDEQVIRLHVTDLSRGFFNSMIPYFFQEGMVPEQLVEMKFREMVFHLLSDPQNQSLVSYLGQLDQRQMSLGEVMESNYRYNLSMAEFARIANRSLSTFKREFISLYGIPPGKWLLNKRLEHAELLLTQSGKAVTEIADDSGFESQSHFNRAFKERYGATPLQYRAQGQAGANV